MLPCARSCIGKKLNSLPAACADSITTEPLLFLYPAWFRDTVQDTASIKTRGSRQWSSHRRDRSRVAVADAEISDHLPYSANTSATSESKSTQDCKASSNKLVSSQTTVTPSPRSSILWLEKEWRPFVENTGKVKREDRLQPSDSRPVRGLIRYHGFNKHVNRDVDVLKLADTLASYPPSMPDELDEIWLETIFLKWLTGTVEENIWKHSDGSGCVVHVHPPPKKDRPTRKVTLIGSQRAREIATQYLQDLQKNYHAGKLDKSLSDGSSDEDSCMNVARVRVDQLPKPSEWNLQSFAAYVTTVTKARAPRNIERILYPKNDTFNKAAAKVLVELFEDPNLQPFQSSFALRQVLKMCSVNTDIAFAARKVWTAARQAGVVPDVACFNYELSRYFKVENMAGVSRLIHEMRNIHVQPNGATWACLFSSLRGKEEQSMFLQFPSVQKAKLDRVSKDVMAQAFVKVSFEPSDRNLQCLRQFKKKMIGVFGVEWLSSSVLKSMIDKCTQAGAFRTLSKVLELATDQSINPDAETLTSLLGAVVETGCFDDVLMLLRLQTSPLESGLDRRQIELVFREAWRQRFFNMCRVLWHYAASHGTTEHSMVTKIAGVITRNVSPEEESSITAASRMAVFTIGTDRSNTMESKHDPDSQDQAILEALTSLSQWSPNGEARHNQMQLAHVLIERDMTAWQRHAPMDYSELMELMDEAFALDILWLEQNKVLLTPLSELLQQAIPINLRPLGSPIKVLESSLGVEGRLTESQVPTLPNKTSMLTSEERDKITNDRFFLIQDGFSPAKVENRTHTLAFQDSHQPLFSNDVPAIAHAATTASFSNPLIDLLLHRLGLARDNG